MPPVQPVQSFSQTEYSPVSGATPGQAMVQLKTLPSQKNDTAGLIKTIAIIVVSLIAVTFVGLFVWMFMQYNEAKTDIDGQIAVAVAAAKDEQANKDEAEFLEREKYPYKTFSGPADYGQLTFEYPKTWSVYVAADASTGGDFSAYFNPIQVNTVSAGTINALRVTIRDKSFDEVVAEYQRYMDREDSGLTVESITVNGTAANRYSGNIPNTELNGLIVIFKIRDKTAVLQTDSVLFKDDFDKLVETVTQRVVK